MKFKILSWNVRGANDPDIPRNKDIRDVDRFGA